MGSMFLTMTLTPFGSLTKHLIATRQPVVINENSPETGKQYGLIIVEGTLQYQNH